MKQFNLILLAVPMFVTLNSLAMDHDEEKEPLLSHKTQYHSGIEVAKKRLTNVLKSSDDFLKPRILAQKNIVLTLLQLDLYKQLGYWCSLVCKIVSMKSKNELSVDDWNNFSGIFKIALSCKSSKSGNTPLHYAVLQGSEKFVYNILRCCVILDININELKNNNNVTPLDLLNKKVRQKLSKDSYRFLAGLFVHAQCQDLKKLDLSAELRFNAGF